MNKDKEIRSVEVFRGVIHQAHMVANLLENEGIEAYILDEISGGLNLPWDDGAGVGMVKVAVSSKDFEKARDVVKAYQQNLEEE